MTSYSISRYCGTSSILVFAHSGSIGPFCISENQYTLQFISTNAVHGLLFQMFELLSNQRYKQISKTVNIINFFHLFSEESASFYDFEPLQYNSIPPILAVFLFILQCLVFATIFHLIHIYSHDSFRYTPSILQIIGKLKRVKNIRLI